MDLEILPTIEDDEEVDGEESDSEEEVTSSGPRKQQTKSTFSDDFEFFQDGQLWEDEVNWDIDNDVMQMAIKKQRPQTSLDEKIARAREIKRLKKEEQKEELTAKAMADKLQKVKGSASLSDSRDSADEVNGMDSSDDSDSRVSDDEEESCGSFDEPTGEEPEDTVKVKKSKKQSDNAFFDEPPPQKSDVNFTDMNLSRPILKAVTSLGFVNPTPIQASCVPVALMGKDICACAATGTGKTAAFMLPIIERLLYRPTHTRIVRVLILTPTRELAIQVHSVGKALSRHTDIEFCLAAGGLDSKSQEAMLRKNPDVIVATPGRLVDHLHNAPSFTLSTVEILVLDEADRMLDEHFEDQLNDIIKLCPKSRQTMLFSATMTDQVEELARLSLNRPVRLFVDSNTDVAENLRQEFVRIKAKRELDREAIVTALCCRTFKEHCLIFLNTKKAAHRMRIILGLLNLRSSELHGNLSQLQRIEALKQFKEGDVDFLVATDLASRGLDIERVKTVINFSMPSSVKQYIHRVGRTARAGRSGRSVSLVGEKERKLLKDIVKSAKYPVKSRVIPQEVIVKYRDKIRKLESEIKEILKQEGEEKQLRLTEMEVNKARNLVEHEKEIFSRPKRTWIQTGKKRPSANDATAGSDDWSSLPLSKKRKREEIKMKTKTKQETPEEKAEKLKIKYETRVAKKARKKKRVYAVHPGEDRPKKIGKVQSQSVIKSFEQELTDTSKKTLKSLRKTPQMFSNSQKGSRFKSKKRYKRR